jgi:nucleoside-diphosphate-sugar epimerase
MRVLITGAGGVIGSRMVNKILPELDANGNISFLMAIDRVGITPSFSDDELHKWTSINLDEVSALFWENIIRDNFIDRVYYIETTENLNMRIPGDTINNRFNLSDRFFIEYLEGLETLADGKKLEVVYISTEQVYRNDPFPEENHGVVVNVPEVGDPVDDNRLVTYMNDKISSEVRLNVIDTIKLRIIRPFAIVAPEQLSDFPLTTTILKAIAGTDLTLYGSGYKGLAFTHVKDLVDFLFADSLFDPNIEMSLSSNKINVCRVWTYLAEYLLIRKIKNKLDSNSLIIPNTDKNNFPNMMRTPQIRNMSKIFIPRITIEEIIEEIAQARNPQNSYAPLIIDSVHYTSGPILHISGRGEPKSNVLIYLGTGETLHAAVLGNGTWATETDGPYMSEEAYEAEVRIISSDGIQYQTERVTIPSSSNWDPPLMNSFIVDTLRFIYNNDTQPKLVFEMAGLFEKDGLVTVDLPIVDSEDTMHLEATVDKYDAWQMETPPDLYSMPEEDQIATIRVYTPTGALHYTEEFEVPVSPEPPVNPEPPVYYTPVNVEVVEYKKEVSGDQRQYLNIKGIAEPETTIVLDMPGSSNSEITNIRLEDNVDDTGKWEVNTPAPYYMLEINKKGKVSAFLQGGNIYSLTEFDIPRSEENPPAPPAEHPFFVKEAKFNLDGFHRPYLEVNGEAPDGTTVKVNVDEITMSTLVLPDNTWSVETPEPLYTPASGTYGEAIMYYSDGTRKKTINFLVPPSPIGGVPPEEVQLEVTNVEYVQLDTANPDNNYLHIQGIGPISNRVKIEIPDLNNEAGVIVLEVIVSAENLWEVYTTEEYNADKVLNGKADSYNTDGLHTGEVIFSIPKSPDFLP